MKGSPEAEVVATLQIAMALALALAGKKVVLVCATRAEAEEQFAAAERMLERWRKLSADESAP